MSLTDFVNSFTYEDIRQLHIEWEYFEKNGFIDECLLRKKADEYRKLCSIPDNNHVLWMKFIMFEVYKRISKECYFEE